MPALCETLVQKQVTVVLYTCVHLQEQHEFADVLAAVEPHYAAIRRILRACISEKAEKLSVQHLQSQLAEANSRVQEAESSLKQHEQLLDLAKQGSFSPSFVQEAETKLLAAQEQLRVEQHQQFVAHAHFENTQAELSKLGQG